MTADYGIDLARFVIPALCGLVASVIDVRQRKIPNALSVPLLATGLLFRGVTGGWAGLLDGLEGFAAGFAILFVLWIIGGGGAGDVKFMAAVGAWLGPKHLIIVFVLSAVLVLVYSVLMLISRLFAGKSLRPKSAAGADTSEATPRRPALPYAVPATAAIVLELARWMLIQWMLIHRQS